MRNTGFRRPRLTVLIWLVIALVAWVAVAWGVFEMQRLGHETGYTATAIGGGFPVAVIASGMLLLAMRGARTVAAITRPENMLGRWRVSPDELAAFAVNNTARNALGVDYQNDWTPPRTIPPDGIEIIFAPDGVLVGDTYFGLVNTGMFKFQGAQMLPGNPLAIEFGMVATTGTHISHVVVRTHHSVLRLPVSRLARDEAVRVLDHFKRVDAREIVVNAGFYLSRIRIGLWVAAVSFPVAAFGFAMAFSGYANNDIVDPALLAGLGVILGIGGLTLALLAWWLRMGQYRK